MNSTISWGYEIILTWSLNTYLICRCSPTKSRLKSFNLIKLSLYWPLRGLLVEQVIRRSRSVIAVTCMGEEDALSNLISLVASAKNAFQRSRSLCSAALESFKKNILIVFNSFNLIKKVLFVILWYYPEIDWCTLQASWQRDFSLIFNKASRYSEVTWSIEIILQ